MVLHTYLAVPCDFMLLLAAGLFVPRLRPFVLGQIRLCPLFQHINRVYMQRVSSMAAEEKSTVICPPACITCRLLRNKAAKLLPELHERQKHRPMYIRRICSEDFLDLVSEAAGGVELSQIEEIRICISCYKQLTLSSGHQWRRSQVYILGSSTEPKSAVAASSAAPPLRLIPPGTSERYPQSSIRCAFSLPEGDPADWPISEAAAGVKLPLEREAHSLANAALFATFAWPNSAATGPTYQDLQNIANFALGAAEHTCPGCKRATAFALLQRSVSDRATLTPTLALACGSCGHILGRRLIRIGHTGVKGLRLTAQTANSVTLATNSFSSARKVLSSVGTACPSKSTLHRTATRTGKAAADRATAIAAERVRALAAYLDELGLNEPIPETLSDAEALEVLAKTPIYIAVDGTYSSIARNNAAWSAVAFFVVSTKTRVSTPLLTLSRRAGHVAGSVEEHLDSTSTTKGLERLLVQEGISFFRQNGLVGVPLIVADQDAGVANELQKFSWVVGTDKNHYFLSFTRQIVDLQKRMTTEMVAATDISKLSVVTEVRQYMEAKPAPAPTSAAASSGAGHRETSLPEASSDSDKHPLGLLDCTEECVGLGILLEALGATDEKVHEATKEDCWGIPLLVALEHIDAEGRGKLDPLRDAAAEHHARLELHMKTVSPEDLPLMDSEAANGDDKRCAIPPAKVVAYLKSKLVSIVYQAAKMAGGRSHRMRELLNIAIEHYSGNHQNCRLLYPTRDECVNKTYSFPVGGAFLSFLDHLFSEYFGSAEQVSMGALCMTMVMSTNCCEAFNSKIRTYAPKKDALIANWYQIVHKTFLDMTSGRSMWRQSVHNDLGSQHIRSAATFYNAADDATVAAQNRVRAGIESAYKASRSARKRLRTAQLTSNAAAEYTSRTDRPLPGLNAAACLRDDLHLRLSQVGNLSQQAMSERAEVSTAASGFHRRGRKRPAASTRTKKRQVKSSASAAVDISDDECDKVLADTTSEEDVDFGGSSSDDLEDQSAHLSKDEGAARGWQEAGIRFVPNLDGHDWFTREIFIKDAWRQFYYEAKTGRLDRGEDGRVAFTSAEHMTSSDSDSDCERPAGVMAMHSVQHGYATAAAATPEEMETYFA